jgi:hypothetical protein
MKNYEFIIAGLPYLEPDFDNPVQDYESVSARYSPILTKKTEDISNGSDMVLNQRISHLISTEP